MQINSSFPLLNRSRIITICSILTVLVLLNGCSNQPITKSVPQHKGLADQVTLNPAVLTNNIASDFLGDGVEPYRMCDFVRLYHATPAMANLLMNLGVPPGF